MLNKLKRTLATAMVLVSCTAAFAQKTKTVEGGGTSVALSSGFVAALQSLGVTPGTVEPTKLQNGKASFPINGGALDLKTLKGEIIHIGGLTLTARSTEVRLQAFIIDTTGSAPVLTGLVIVNGGLLARVPLFDINLSRSSIKLAGDDLTVRGVGLTLDKTAAAALNQIFNVSAFKAGLPIGTATVTAELD